MKPDKNITRKRLKALLDFVEKSDTNRYKAVKTLIDMMPPDMIKAACVMLSIEPK